MKRRLVPNADDEFSLRFPNAYCGQAVETQLIHLHGSCGAVESDCQPRIFNARIQYDVFAPDSEFFPSSFQLAS